MVRCSEGYQQNHRFSVRVCYHLVISWVLLKQTKAVNGAFSFPVGPSAVHTILLRRLGYLLRFKNVRQCSLNALIMLPCCSTVALRHLLCCFLTVSRSTLNLFSLVWLFITWCAQWEQSSSSGISLHPAVSEISPKCQHVSSVATSGGWLIADINKMCRGKRLNEQEQTIIHVGQCPIRIKGRMSFLTLTLDWLII